MLDELKGYYNYDIFEDEAKHVLVESLNFEKCVLLFRKLLGCSLDKTKVDTYLFSDYYRPAVELFVRRLEEVKPNFDFYLLKRNVKTMTIKSKIFFKGEKIEDLLAFYCFRANEINLSAGNIFSSIYHELMHMASTDAFGVYDLFCGFSQINYLRSVGCSFNEGYTELLTERYFFDQGIDYSYSIEVMIAKMAEKIVGREKMEELFFKADLYGLGEEFIKDAKKEEFIQFLDDVDYVHSKRDGKYTEEFKDIYQRTWEFLYFTYFKKQVRLYDNGEISEDNYQKNITFILDLIVSKRCFFDNHDFSHCNRDRIKEQIEELGFEVDFSLIDDDKIVEEVETKGYKK